MSATVTEPLLGLGSKVYLFSPLVMLLSTLMVSTLLIFNTLSFLMFSTRIGRSFA